MSAVRLNVSTELLETVAQLSPSVPPQAKCHYALEIRAGTLPGFACGTRCDAPREDVVEKLAADLANRAPVIRLPERRARRVNT